MSKRKFKHHSELTINVLTSLVREADEIHQDVGGGTRHWVRDCFLPTIEKHGYHITLEKVEADDLLAATDLAWPRGCEGCKHSKLLCSSCLREYMAAKQLS